MEYQLYKNIVSNPDICNGRPTLKGTRITVNTIMSYVLAGENDEDILEGYSRVTKEDIKTCKEFTTLLLEKPILLKSLKASA